MLSAGERTQILDALSMWAKTAPDEPMIGFIGLEGSGLPMTPRILVKQICERTPSGNAFLEMVEHSVRREGVAKCVERITRATAADEVKTVASKKSRLIRDRSVRNLRSAMLDVGVGETSKKTNFG